MLIEALCCVLPEIASCMGSTHQVGEFFSILLVLLCHKTLDDGPPGVTE